MQNYIEGNFFTPPEDLSKKSQLYKVREHLNLDPSIMVAGEIASFDGYKWDHHDLFIAPTVPTLDEKKLTEIAQHLASSVPPSFMRNARQYSDWNLQLPDLHYDETVGKITTHKVTKTATTMFGSYIEGISSGVKEEIEEEEHPLIQRTNVRIYPDIYTAHLLYTATKGRLEEKIESIPDELIVIYHTHQLSQDAIRLIQEHAEKAHTLRKIDKKV